MPRITVAIPTYNRAKYLPQAVQSVLNQTLKDFELLIADNASTDETGNITKSFKDERIVYHKNKKNIGMMNNWNRCIDLSEGKYLLILGDDDKLYPNFLEESYRVHKRYPDLGFSFSHCNKVDANGQYLARWGYDFLPAGYSEGWKYLDYTIKFGCNLTNSSTVLLNKSVFKKVGKFEAEYATNTFDFNMWIKIVSKFSVYFIDEVLSDYRIHPEQVSELHWRRKKTGKIGTYLEIYGAISELLSNREYIKIPGKKEFLSKSVKEINKELARLLTGVLPEL